MSERAVQRAAWVLVALCACGGGQSAAAGGAGGSSGGVAPVTNTVTTAPEGSGEHRSGLQIHVQNLHAGGNLPDPADRPVDHLDISFELQLTHSGTEPLTGIRVTRARLVNDDQTRQVSFGVLNTDWDGRLDPGQQRTILFRKTPDSSTPPPTRALCGTPVRVEITLDLAGRQATAYSRHTQIECPGAQGQ